MNTTKKLLVVIMVALLAAVSAMPSTFSWYNHSASADGKYLKYTKTDLPVSMRAATGSTKVTMSTVVSDANNIKTTTAATRVSLAAGNVQYYTTTLTNTCANPVYVDLNMKNLVNNADFIIGTISPTLNEKAYASKAVRSKVSYTKTRVYFKTHPNYSSFWAVDNGRLVPESTAAAGSSTQSNSSTGTTNDINIAYMSNGGTTETMAKMIKCSGSDSNHLGNTSTKVYYYDLPSDAEYFYFFNHWYLASASSREWNRTYNITDTKTKGVMYYLTGNMVGEELYKECKALDPNPKLVALNSYYGSVRMSTGNDVFADIGLKKESDEEDFIPEYYGNTITYRSSATGVATINKDGVITPVSSGDATITTTVTGLFGDTADVTTALSIPANIAEVPILQNILVRESGATDSTTGEALDKVEIHWYALNKSSSATMTTSNIFITI